MMKGKSFEVVCLICWMASLVACFEPNPTPRTENSAPDLSSLEDMSTDLSDLGTPDETPDAPTDKTPDMMPVRGLIVDPNHQSDTDAQLEVFYRTYGGQAAFSSSHRQAFEALLRAEDELINQQRQLAGVRVDGVFADQPKSTPAWNLGANQGTNGSNTGHPVAYYGLRMIEQISQLDAKPNGQTLYMTGVIARCTNARLPQPEGIEPVTQNVQLHPEILKDDARRLFLATNLFRRWIFAITQGSVVDLRLYVLETCAKTDFTDDGKTIISYPDTQAMVDAVPAEIAANTDIWWVVAPSGVQQTEMALNRHTITGGMGLSQDGRPLIISDDLWFVRKPNHMGKGKWTEVELRTYHPQWFQHEFMHHLFRTWPQYGLEEKGHQWFDRSTWPDDFQGVFEPDYYAEAINKRLLGASPSLAEGLDIPEAVAADQFELSAFVGNYERQPVENPWHQVNITSQNGRLYWNNAANVSWSLEINGATLQSGQDCPYGVSPLKITAKDNQIQSLVFNGESYVRVF